MASRSINVSVWNHKIKYTFGSMSGSSNMQAGVFLRGTNSWNYTIHYQTNTSVWLQGYLMWLDNCRCRNQTHHQLQTSINKTIRIPNAVKCCCSDENGHKNKPRLKQLFSIRSIGWILTVLYILLKSKALFLVNHAKLGFYLLWLLSYEDKNAHPLQLDLLLCIHQMIHFMYT